MATVFQLGDRVQVPLDEDGKVWRGPRDAAPHFTVGTIIAENRFDSHCVGWKSDEIAPSDAWTMSEALDKKEIATPRKSSAYAGIPGWETYDTGYWFHGNDLVHAPQQQNSPTKRPITKEEKPDWQIFRNSIPGECACGIAKKDCAYHR